MGTSKTFSVWLHSAVPPDFPGGSYSLAFADGQLGKLWLTEGNDLFIFLSLAPRRELPRAETRSDSSVSLHRPSRELSTQQMPLE